MSAIGVRHIATVMISLLILVNLPLFNNPVDHISFDSTGLPLALQSAYAQSVLITDKTHYFPGDDVNISGNIGQKPTGRALLIQIYNPEGRAYRFDTVFPRDDGYYSYTFRIGGTLGITGEYQVRVTYEGPSVTTTFFFTNTESSGTVSSVTASTNKSSYVSGDTITISGRVQPAGADSMVRIQVFNSDGAAYRFDQVSVSSSGTYSYSFVVGGNLGITGSYQVTVTAQDKSARTSFYFTNTENTSWRTATLLIDGSSRHSISYQLIGGSLRSLTGDSTTATITAVISSTSAGELKLQLPRNVMDSKTGNSDLDFIVSVDELGTSAIDNYGINTRTLSIPFRQGTERIDIVGTFLVGSPGNTTPRVNLSVSTDKSSYNVGDMATITIHLSANTVSGQNVALAITSPTGGTLISRALTTDSQGVASMQFRIANDYPTGRYTVSATSQTNGYNTGATEIFSVGSSSSGASIVSIQATDQQGNPVSAFRKGSLGYVKVVLASESTQSALATVNIFDSSLTSLGVGSVKTTLGAGNSETILSFFIPAGAASGQSEIFANLFSDWPSSGGVPLSKELSIRVQIQ